MISNCIPCALFTGGVVRAEVSSVLCSISKVQAEEALLRNETEDCESLKKQINIKPSTEKKINKGRKEETLCCTKEEITSSEVCISVF